MSGLDTFDHLALAWAAEYRAARHTLSEISTATGLDTSEISDWLQGGVIPLATEASIETRRAIIRDSLAEGLSIKDMARRALAPRAWVAEQAAGVFQEALES